MKIYGSINFTIRKCSSSCLFKFSNLTWCVCDVLVRGCLLTLCGKLWLKQWYKLIGYRSLMIWIDLMQVILWAIHLEDMLRYIIQHVTIVWWKVSALLHCNATPFGGFLPYPVKHLRLVNIFLGLNIAPTISYKEICRIFVSI
jgi:hypothetical protein